MLKGLLLGFVIIASLGACLIGIDSATAAEPSPKEGNQTSPVAKEADQKPATSEEVKKKVDEAKSDKNPECIGMKAQSRPSCPPF
ncbi:MAG: hypothetical protein E8D50_06600 [Nitrospira sp.]|jgi:hypothetical protein|nr:MAG: hypothetical protein E8D50_06600 [Nitrospira sp.]